MKRILEKFASLLANRKAATAVEYGLIASLVCLAAVAAMGNLANATSELWGYVSNEVLANS